MINLYEKAKQIHQENEKLYQEFMAECNSADPDNVKIEKLQDKMQKLADELEKTEIQMQK